MEKIICKKCLLQEMDEEAYVNNLKKYIDRMDDKVKADEQEYGRRLAICKECDYLINGTCGKCGCYVELRAVVKKNHCADVKKKW